MNRSKSVLKNTLWELGYYAIVIAMGLLAPRFIILYYNSEVNGLNSTIQRIINIVLMLQAGATTTAIFSLYKPIAEKNLEEININISSAEMFFRKISFLFSGILLLISFIMPFAMKTELNKLHVFFAISLMGAKNFFDLFFTAKFRIVFTSFQQKYYISIATLVEQVIYYLLVFITIFLRWHFLWMYVWFLVGCLIKIVYLKLVFKKTHLEIKKCFENGKKRKIYGRNYALINELSHSFMSSSVAIIMSAMYGLAETSVYAVYALVSEAVNLITTALYSSFAPGFGDLFAQDNTEQTSKVFSTFVYIFDMFNTWLMMCMLFSVVPFVKLYTDGASDIEYINYSLAILLVIAGVFSAYRIPYNVIVSSCGFFKETWIQPFVSMFICIIASIFFGLLGYSYILIGSVIFYAINFIYQHFKLKKIVPYMISNKVFVFFFITFGGVILTLLLNRLLPFREGVIMWILYSSVFAIAALTYIVVMSLIFAKSHFVDTIKYMRRFKKNN